MSARPKSAPSAENELLDMLDPNVGVIAQPEPPAFDG